MWGLYAYAVRRLARPPHPPQSNHSPHVPRTTTRGMMVAAVDRTRRRHAATLERDERKRRILVASLCCAAGWGVRGVRSSRRREEDLQRHRLPLSQVDLLTPAHHGRNGLDIRRKGGHAAAAVVVRAVGNAVLGRGRGGIGVTQCCSRKGRAWLEVHKSRGETKQPDCLHTPGNRHGPGSAHTDLYTTRAHTRVTDGARASSPFLFWRKLKPRKEAPTVCFGPCPANSR